MIQISREAGKYARKFQMIAAELNRQITEELDKETREIKDEVREIGGEVLGELKDMSDSIAKDTGAPPAKHPESEKQEDLNRDT